MGRLSLAPKSPKGDFLAETPPLGGWGANLEPKNIRYLIYASWGMLRGAMDFMLENKDLIIEDKELFQEVIEQIFLQGLNFK